MKDIVTLGSISQDAFVVSENFKIIESAIFKSGKAECLPYGAKVELENVYFDTGGGASNTAFTFANLGLKTRILSRVGSDSHGKFILENHQKNNLCLKGVSKIAGQKSAYSIILLIKGGDRSILVFRGVNKDYKVTELKWETLVSKWLYITSLAGNSAVLKKAFKIAGQKKIKVAVNPGSQELDLGLSKLKDILKNQEVFNLNREEAVKLTKSKQNSKPEELFKKMKNIKSRYHIITDGKKGAYLSYDGKILYAPSIGTKPVNTTGAGDAFGSGFVAGIMLKNDPEYALKLAILNSDGVIRAMGAKHGLLKKLPGKKDLSLVSLKKI